MGCYLQRVVKLGEKAERVQGLREGRRYLLLQCRGQATARAYIGLGVESAASVDGGFELCPGASLELADGRPDMALYAVGVNGARLVIVEG